MRRRRLLALLGCAAFAPALAAGEAAANWNTNAGGDAYAKSRQMPAGEQPTATVSGRNVTVDWPASSGGTPVSGYLVERYDALDVPAGVGPGCDGLQTTTSCTDEAVDPGDWRYSITPVQANWRGAESPLSALVVVEPPALELDATTVSTLPATLEGAITGFAGGQTVSFRLDDPDTGTPLAGSTAPSPVAASGNADASVTLPAGTAAGAHTIFAVGDDGDVASAAVTVLTSQLLQTTAWELRDASAGGSESDASDQIAFAGDGRTIATTTPSNSFASNRFVLVDFDNPLPSDAAPSSASLDFRFAAGSSLSTACFYFDVRRASSNALLATHGSSASPLGCVSGTGQTSFSTPLPEVTSAAIANDLRVRVYLRASLGISPVLDELTVATGTSAGAFTLYDRVFSDRVNTGSTSRNWPLVASGGTTYTSASTWSSSFSAGRYLRLVFPDYVPASAVVTDATFTHRYRSSGGGTVCWYFQVLQGGTVIGTHGSSGSPISCNSSTSTYSQQMVSVPEIDSPARANGAVIKIYMRNSSSQRSQTDFAQLDIDYSN